MSEFLKVTIKSPVMSEWNVLMTKALIKLKFYKLYIIINYIKFKKKLFMKEFFISR
jgi:hypothetical protein